MKLRTHIRILIFSSLFFSYGSVVSAADFDLTTLHYSSQEAIDVVITGDGFSSQEQAFFQQKAQQAASYLLNSLPFVHRQNAFNIYAMELNSLESGISTLGGVQKDSALGSYRNRDGMMRYSGLPEWGRDKLRDGIRHQFQKKVYVIIILNDSDYIGSGEFPRDDLVSVAQASYDTHYNAFRELVLHEFGHSFGDLADEYGGSCDAQSRPSDWDPVKYDKKNVTHDAVHDRKWDFLPNPQYILGANYCDNEWYRSSPTGLMRSLYHGAEHNELGQYLINQRIDEDLEYNQHVVSLTHDGTLPHNIANDSNVRIHGDRVILDAPLVCNELFIAKGAALVKKGGASIHCHKVINRGRIITEKSGNDRVSRRQRKRRFTFPRELASSRDNGRGVKCELLPLKRFLKRGVKGEDVLRLQQCFSTKGFSLPMSGTFGEETERVVRTFQKREKLHHVDGVVGPEVYHALVTRS